MKTAFFGTPPIAVPSLKALADSSELVGVVCQPDRPAGRGLKARACAVKSCALELGIEVHQPMKVRTGNLHEWLAEREVELVVVLAYGRILPAATLRAPKLGCVNLHASLLPAYRGAAPINWAIANGEQVTGVSLMQMDEGLDTGPIFCRREIPIDSAMTGGILTEKIAILAADMVRSDLAKVTAGILPTPQDESLATHAPPIKAKHRSVSWATPAKLIANQVRAFTPKPGTHATLGKKRCKLLEVSRCDFVLPAELSPGQICLADRKRILVQTSDGTLEIHRAQLEGRKAQGAIDLINGRVFVEGALLE